MKWFHFHTWSMWEEFSKSDIVKPLTGGILGWIFVQKRICHKCGLVQYKQDKIMADV